MSAPKFNIGDTVWMWYGEHNYPATVVQIIPAGSFGYDFPHYIVEVPSSVDPYLDIRPEFLTFAKKGDGPGFVTKESVAELMETVKQINKRYGK